MALVKTRGAERPPAPAASSVVTFRGRVLIPEGEALREVVVEDGVITEIRPFDELRPQNVIALADDEVLLPGLVDTHVHVNEPGRTEWEGFATATAAAAAGGVTTILDMPLNSIPATTSIDALATKRAAADGQCAVDVGFWAGAVPDSLGQLAALHEAGVFGFKCFLLDSGVPEFPPLSADQLRSAMVEIAAFDGLLIVHAEDPEVIAAHAGPGSVHYDRLPRLPAAGRRDHGHRHRDRGRAGDRLPDPSRPPVQRRGPARDRAGPAPTAYASRWRPVRTT